MNRCPKDVAQEDHNRRQGIGRNRGPTYRLDGGQRLVLDNILGPTLIFLPHALRKCVPLLQIPQALSLRPAPPGDDVSLTCPYANAITSECGKSVFTDPFLLHFPTPSRGHIYAAQHQCKHSPLPRPRPHSTFPTPPLGLPPAPWHPRPPAPRAPPAMHNRALFRCETLNSIIIAL
jgi:hypothetical protein